MAGWVRAGSLRGPAGPRGESVVAAGEAAPEFAREGDVWLVTDGTGLTGAGVWHDEGLSPSGTTFPGPGTSPRAKGWNVNGIDEEE